MPIIQVIMQAIKVGVPAAKIISKYGKKSYDIAKKLYKTKNKSKKIEKALLKIPGVDRYVTEMSTPLGMSVLLQTPAWMLMGKLLTQGSADKKEKEKRASIREEARKPEKKITSSKIGLQKRGIVKNMGGIVSLNQMTRSIGYR
jgi:hypothetical protein